MQKNETLLHEPFKGTLSSPHIHTDLAYKFLKNGWDGTYFGSGVCRFFYSFVILAPVFKLNRKMKFEKEIKTVLQSRKSDSDMLNIMDALQYGPDKYQEAFDIALEMDNRSLVKLLYSNFDAGKVMVEFTLLGKK